MGLVDRSEPLHRQVVKRELEQRIMPVLESILMAHREMYGSVQLNVQKGRLISVEVRESHNATGVEQILAAAH